MPSFFSPSPSPGAVISSVAFAIRFFTGVSYNTFVPFSGTVLAHLGQARYPTWASTLPHLGTFCCTDVAHLSPISQTPFGLKQNPASPCFCDEPRLSVPPRMITHPNLPQGKGQVTLLCQRLQQINSANEHQPPLVLPRRGDAGYSAIEFSQSLQPPPNLPRRGGTVTLLCQRLGVAGYSGCR